jgi:hypothetical protein
MERKRIAKGLVNRFVNAKMHERMIRSYYAYYGEDGTDPFFIKPIAKSSPSEPLAVHICRKIRYKRLTTKHLGKKYGSTQVAVFKELMMRIQNEAIVNRAIIPLPLGLGEIAVKTVFTNNSYVKTELDKATNKVVRKYRYAIRTKGKMFKIVWYKAKVRHPAARLYKFEPTTGGVHISNKKEEILVYGNEGLAVKIEEASQNPLGKSYLGNYL